MALRCMRPFGALMCAIAIHFIADDQGAFTGALGMLFDASPLLGAPRSKVSATLNPCDGAGL